jgi:hypothetical protein
MLFNEEFFIILAFFSLCFFVKTNLGNVVENELKDRKEKILSSYLDFLNKKSKNVNLVAKNTREKINYLFNFSEIQKGFFSKFDEMVDLTKTQLLTDLVKNFETKFVLYFANLVSFKRKFLI